MEALLKKNTDCARFYEKVFVRNTKKDKQSLARGAKNCLDQKEFQKAFQFLEVLLWEQKRDQAEVGEIKEIKLQLAEISFYKLKDYHKALKYYTSLLTTGPLQKEEAFFLQKQIAESFFSLAQYKQALRETEKGFLLDLSLKQKKAVVFLKSRILLEMKAFTQALSFFEKQIEEFPEEESFFREYKAFVYEEKKDFLSAIRELERVHPSNRFIKRKIQRLMERQESQPGF